MSVKYILPVILFILFLIFMCVGGIICVVLLVKDSRTPKKKKTPSTVCPSCGYNTNPDFIVCPRCGKFLDETRSE